jgi:hypothetical protein
MAYNTVAEVKDYGRFKNSSDSVIQTCIDAGDREVDRLGEIIPPEDRKFLALLASCHFVALSERQATDKTRAGLSVSYASPTGKDAWCQTTWGEQFWEMVQRRRGPLFDIWPRANERV